MKIFVVGLGLIGGSVCKAFKKYTSHEIGGYDIYEYICRQALNDRSIDIIIENLADLKNYDIGFICLPPTTLERFVCGNTDNFRENAIIADVCGVKGNIADTLTEIALKHKLKYVSVHPMAGRERGGYDNSQADLFMNANFITTPVENTDLKAVEAIEALAKEIGFRNFSRVAPGEHDSIIAYTSQLAHIVSSAYVKSPLMDSVKGFTGGSFQDMTRIATMNEDMWADLFLQNKEKLLREIDILQGNISEYRRLISQNDKDALRHLIKASSRLKEKDLKNAKFPTRFD